ncbi:MAG: hypothetical protein KDI55_00010 [Anaerolineae bacterium]|nr:hypothetical protein [Anaerolineae bacterium]
MKMRKDIPRSMDLRELLVAVTQEHPRSEEMMSLDDISRLFADVIGSRREDMPALTLPRQVENEAGGADHGRPIDTEETMVKVNLAIRDAERRIAEEVADRCVSAETQIAEKNAVIEELSQRIQALEARMLADGLKQGLTGELPLTDMPEFLGGALAASAGESSDPDLRRLPHPGPGSEDSSRVLAIEEWLGRLEAGVADLAGRQDRIDNVIMDLERSEASERGEGQNEVGDEPIRHVGWRETLIGMVRDAGREHRNSIMGASVDDRDTSRRMVEMAYRARSGNVRSRALISIVADGRGMNWDALARSWIENYEAHDRIMARTFGLEEGAIIDIGAATNEDEARGIADQIVAAIADVTGEVEDDGSS